MVQKAVGDLAVQEVRRCVYAQGAKLCAEPAGFWPVLYYRTESGEDIYHLLLLAHCDIHRQIAQDRGDPLKSFNFKRLDEECRDKGHGGLVVESLQLGWSSEPFLACQICGRRDGLHHAWCQGERHVRFGT